MNGPILARSVARCIAAIRLEPKLKPTCLGRCTFDAINPELVGARCQYCDPSPRTDAAGPSEEPSGPRACANSRYASVR